MAKNVAVLVVNPVNGLGLFQYLEAFFENGISYTTFAVAETKEIQTNSGVGLVLDDVVANLKGKEEQFDAVVFSCGDAMPVFAQHADKVYNQDLLSVLSVFVREGKMVIGHCAVALLLGGIPEAAGKRVAVHPFAKQFVQGVVPTDEVLEIDGNFYTAQTENTLYQLIPELVKVLKS